MIRSLERGSRWLILSIAPTIVALSIQAAPYDGDIYTYRQPDGTTFDVRLYGDEFFAYQETVDGHLLIRDSDTSSFCYAKRSADGRQLLSTGIPVGKSSPPEMKRAQRLIPGAAMALSLPNRAAMGANSEGRRTRGAARDAKGTVTPLAPPAFTSTGERIGLVLMAAFPDRPDDVVLTRADVDAYCNDPNYTAFGNSSSVYTYFKVQSNGSLRYNNIVSTYFTAAQPRAYYTDINQNYTLRAKELVREGLEALDAQGFDFSQCDADGNLLIDGINLFYAGDRVNSWGEGIWPHQGGASWSGFSGHGLFAFYPYQITELGDTLKLGTFCHENGHMVCGFPDLYGYDDSAARLSRYSLMASSGTFHPGNIDAYLKWHAGWADVTDLTATHHQRCAVQVDRNHFYRYRNPTNPLEYFLFELRDETGYEGPTGGAVNSIHPTRGVVAYHALETGRNARSSIVTAYNPTNSYAEPYELLVIEANPIAAVTPWYDDPTPGRGDGYYIDGVTTLSSNTRPALAFWDSTGRNTPSALQVEVTSLRSNAMTFIVGQGPLTNAPTINLTVTSLVARTEFGTQAEPMTFGLFNTGTGTVDVTLHPAMPWLNVSQSNGTLSTACLLTEVTFDSDVLASGTHDTHINVFDSANTNTPAQTIPVRLTIDAETQLAVAPQSFTPTLASGDVFRDYIDISNSGGGLLNYTVDETLHWFGPDATNGNVRTEVDRIFFEITNNLTAGLHTGQVCIASLNDTNDTVIVSIVLQSLPPPQALLALQPPQIDAGTLHTNTSTPLSFSLHNAGTITLNGIATPGTGLQVTSNASYSIAAGDTQQVALAYTPATPGPQLETIVFSGGGGATGTVIALALGDADSDADGASDWSEYIAGTAWTNPSDVFAIGTYTLKGFSNDAVLSWPTVSGRWYTVLASTNINATTWAPLQTLAGTGSEASYTNTTATNAPHYIRLSVQPAP